VRAWRPSSAPWTARCSASFALTGDAVKRKDAFAARVVPIMQDRVGPQSIARRDPLLSTV